MHCTGRCNWFKQCECLDISSLGLGTLYGAYCEFPLPTEYESDADTLCRSFSWKTWVDSPGSKAAVLGVSEELVDWLGSASNDRPSTALGGGSVYGAYVLGDSATSSANGGEPFNATAGSFSYTLLFNSTAVHSAPFLMNRMNEALLRFHRGGTEEVSLVARNYPLPYSHDHAIVMSMMLSFTTSLFCLIAFAFIPAAIVAYIVAEKETNVKHQQLVSGTSLTCYWLSNYIFDLTCYLVPCGCALALLQIFDVKSFIECSQDTLSSIGGGSGLQSDCSGQDQFVAVALVFFGYGLPVESFYRIVDN